MPEIKLSIKKLKVFNEKFTRYYEVDKIIFRTGIDFITEAQLAYYIFKRHGIGRFLCISWMKKQEGFWKYWNGDIMENGFCRDRDKNKELESLQKELYKSKDYEEREMIEEEIDFEREITKEIKSTKRPQAFGLIKSKPGQLNAYEPF
jgi:hypothetical protein